MLNKKIIFSAAFLLIFFGFSNVYADSISDDPEKDLALNNDIKTARKELSDNKQFFNDANLNWERNHDDYINDPTDENLAAAITFAKQLINQAIDYVDSYYSVAAARLDNLMGINQSDKTTLSLQITAEKNWLQTQRVAIAEATDTAGISNIAITLNNNRQEKMALYHKLVGFIGGSRISKSITKLTDAGNRITDQLAMLALLGKDVADLETSLAAFKDNLSLANEKYAMAIDGLRSISSADTAKDDFAVQKTALDEASDFLIDANTLLAEMIADLKKIKAAEVGGSGDLQLSVDGFALISGKNKITVAAEEELTAYVYDWKGNLIVETTGGTTTEKIDRKTTYAGFSEATFNGGDYLILLTGSIKSLAATGEGRAYLEGIGIYQANTADAPLDIADGGTIYNISSLN